MITSGQAMSEGSVQARSAQPPGGNDADLGLLEGILNDLVLHQDEGSDPSSAVR